MIGLLVLIGWIATSALYFHAQSLQSNQIEALNIKTTMLQSEIDMIVVQNVSLPDVLMIEEGNCETNFNPQYIDYKLFSYKDKNLTLYYVEFGTISLSVTASMTAATTSSLCSSTPYNFHFYFDIVRCYVNRSDLQIPSMINHNFDSGNNIISSFSQNQVNLFRLNGGTIPILISYVNDFSPYGPCAPNTYYFDSYASAPPSTILSGFGIGFTVYFRTSAMSYNFTILPGLRIPILGTFGISK